MTGFVALHRQATSHHLFAGQAARLGAWCWLFANVCWRPTRFSIAGKTITLDRGQICVSRTQLAEAWGWSPSAVERFLRRLQTEQMIERETGQGRSIITLCNYDKYQDFGEGTGQASEQVSGRQANKRRTAKEQGNKGTREDEEAKASPSSTRGARNTRKKSEPFQLPDWVPQPAWDAYVAMRNKIRKPMTDRAKTLAVGMLNKLSAAGNAPDAVLDQSTFNSWQGLFELKDDVNANGQIDRRGGFERACDDAIASLNSGAARRSAAGRPTATTRDAMHRALELTGGADFGGTDGSQGSDARVDAVPHPMRSVGDERR